MEKLNTIISNHISNWNMVWFGLIFWGSIFNAIATNYETTLSPILWYASGLFLGVIAKIRGTWLWKV
ncbi:hypothetical protein N9D68_02445 [Gammaproteobacteria bacterium]|nr:hypothetical protein [Gammaproteobacteria bacterium]